MTDEHATGGYNEASSLEPLLTINGACDLLSISRNTLYRLVDRGELRPTRVGERLRFQPDDVRAYLERGRQ